MFSFLRKLIRFFKFRDKKVDADILTSRYVSRDLSWLKFNYRVFDQAKVPNRGVFDRLKFMAITSSNFDEFFMIRVGSLYNYIDYKKDRTDYSGLKAEPFRKRLFEEIQEFYRQYHNYFEKELVPELRKNKIKFVTPHELEDADKLQLENYYKSTIHPMLTPMMMDAYHAFPILNNKTLIFGVISKVGNFTKAQQRISFVQIPLNIARYYVFDKGDNTLLIPIEEVIRWQIYSLYKNVDIESINLFRIIRNGDFAMEDIDDSDTDFIKEMRKKINTRRTGRVVKVEVESGFSKEIEELLKREWKIDDLNFVRSPNLLDYTSFWQILKLEKVKPSLYQPPAQVHPLYYHNDGRPILEYLKDHDIMLHHPYNSMEIFLNLLESAAEDPNVLSIKITIYRLAKDSRITKSLHRAAELGKHVSVLFEVKARFDEENNINQAQWLQKAGCFVIYGLGNVKTHTKLCLIVRKDPDSEKVIRYVHMSSGNYNEITSRIYTDLALLSTKEHYANDVSEFFNVITGHSQPEQYKYLIAPPENMREELIKLVDGEIANHKKGLKSGIVIKINSLQDLEFIEALYRASQQGVVVKLIIRGMCCLRPQRVGLSENITVRSIVGEFLEHARLFYFHNDGDPVIYGGSADAMVRSFDRRVESLYLITEHNLKQEAINILDFNLKDNVNAYDMDENGEYTKMDPQGKPFNIHYEFFNVTQEVVDNARLFN
ncbi:MAG TPA: polyphosphate kinase 1 [Cytophagales bacterium]|nr:polyphosphate kinase 1 [Cytophagales bacterium]